MSLCIQGQESTNIEPEAQFIVPGWGDKVDFDVGLSNLPARPHRLAAVRQPYRLYPQKGTMNLATGATADWARSSCEPAKC
jgi:hypothetical protein